MVRIHLDTDLGGDTDDACALAMLLGCPEVDLIGVTTNLDEGGRRAGCVAHVLELAGRTGIDVAAGASASMTTLGRYASTWDDDRYWPDPITPLPARPGASLDLLHRSIREGATVTAIGAYTNLAMLAAARPSALDGVRVVAMGGWLRAPADGFPQWGPQMDFNVQSDTHAAEVLLASGADLTLVPLWPTMTVQLRRAHLSQLRAAGALGALLARQAEVHAAAYDMNEMGRCHAGLDDDLLNFQWDPVTCAAAAGWPGLQTRETHLTAKREGDLLRFYEEPAERPVAVLDGVDPDGFTDAWLRSIEHASS